MVSDHKAARATLFRAIVGEEPIPSAAEVAQAKLDLRGSAEFHAALDELVSIILIKQRDMGQEEKEQEAWPARLQAYIAAQLDGQPYVSEFADVRRALDASVSLSEEYALLYTTMEQEWRGTLPVPLDIPPLNFSALDLPLLDAPMPEARSLEPGFAEPMSTSRKVWPLPLLGQRWFNTNKRAWQMFCTWLGLDKLGAVVQPVMVFVLTIALVAGLWRTLHPFGASSISTPTYITETIITETIITETVKHQDSFYQTQMQLETPFPTAATTIQSGSLDDDYFGCRFLRPATFARSVCKL